IYTESHPKLQAIREELVAARMACQSEPRTRVEVTTAPDSVFEQIRLELSQEEPLLESLTAKAATVQRQLADVRSQLRSLNTDGLRLANLEREIELREADYRKYAANLEQARIDDALEARRMSNINVVQPASFEARPIRPRGVLNLALGVMIGLFGAVGLAFFAEYTDRSFRSVADIEQKLELPALVAIPRMKHRAFTINGRN
ncbi:MAG: GNVR domain-containing protein, partial [Patescibacteria group bacterium]|nr:GNVR domain-containing protein [Patescibacteria group bacterium]